MSRRTDNRSNDSNTGSGIQSDGDIQALLERRRFLLTASRTAATAPAVSLLLAAGMKPNAARASIYDGTEVKIKDKDKDKVKVKDKPHP